MIRTIRLGLAGLALAATAVFMAAPAMAADYTSTCGGFAGGTYDNVLINDTTGSCTIGSNVTANFAISIKSNGPISAKNLTLNQATGDGNYGNIYVSGPSTVVLGNVLAAPTIISLGGSIAINAGTTLRAGTITTDFGGYIDLQVQQQSGTSVFVIGTTGTNGVGKLYTSGTNTTGTDYKAQGSTAVHVSNGPIAGGGIGGITLTSMGDLEVVNGGGSRGGAIFLDAQNGPLKIPSGDMNVNGTGLIGGGSIMMLANSVTLTGAVTLNAGQSPTAPTFSHQVNIAASTITYGTLILNSNGDGLPVGSPEAPLGLPGSVNIYSQGQLTFQDTQGFDGSNRLTSLVIKANYPATVPFSSLNMIGTGAFTATANGTDTQVQILAYPATISGTTFSFSSTGLNNHYVGISNGNNILVGSPGVSFTATGNVTMDASAAAGAQPNSIGALFIVSGNASFTSDQGKTFLLKANGPPTGDGDGGIVDIDVAGGFTLDPGTILSVQANAAAVGSGKAQKALMVPALDMTNPFKAIEFRVAQGPVINLGNGAGLISLSAKSGATGGDGGAVLVDTALGIHVTQSLAVDASAIGPTTGQGGDIQLFAEAANNFVSFDYSRILAIKATGGTTSGSGGTVLANQANTPNLAPINVSNSIQVDGGSTLWSTGGFDGSISLNGISCTQQAVGTTWPKSYWDCALTNPTDPPTSREQAIAPAAQSLPSSFKTTLSNMNVALFIYKQTPDYETFTAYPMALPLVAGFNDVSSSTAEVFENGPNQLDVSQYLQGDIMHELGHLMDAYSSTLSQQPAFQGDQTQTIRNITGRWPVTQDPTCAALFGNSTDAQTICATLPGRGPLGAINTPWDVYLNWLIQSNVANTISAELFAESFQYCSGYPLYRAPLQFVEGTVYEIDLFQYQASFYGGACGPQQQKQP